MISLFSKKHLFRTLIVKNFVVFSFLLSANNISADALTPIKIMTETYPPYNMEVDGKVSGLSSDILEAMLIEMGSTQTRQDFKLSSWSRAYFSAEKNAKFVLSIIDE